LIQNTYNPRRVEQPMKRTNPQKGCAHDSSFEPVSWDEAYKIIINAILWQTHPNGRAKHSEPPLAHEAIAECDHAIRDEGHWLTIVLFALPIIAPHISLPILTIARGGGSLDRRLRVLEMDNHPALWVFPRLLPREDTATRLRKIRRPGAPRWLAAVTMDLPFASHERTS